MIHVIGTNSAPTKQMTAWFDEHDLKYDLTTIGTGGSLDPKLITKLLILSPDGFESILSSHTNGASYMKSHPNMTTTRLIQMIAKRPRMLRLPIAYDDTKVASGIRDSELGKFISKEQRRKDLEAYLGAEYLAQEKDYRDGDVYRGMPL